MVKWLNFKVLLSKRKAYLKVSFFDAEKQQKTTKNNNKKNKKNKTTTKKQDTQLKKQ